MAKSADFDGSTDQLMYMGSSQLSYNGRLGGALMVVMESVEMANLTSNLVINSENKATSGIQKEVWYWCECYIIFWHCISKRRKSTFVHLKQTEEPSKQIRVVPNPMINLHLLRVFLARCQLLIWQHRSRMLSPLFQWLFVCWLYKENSYFAMFSSCDAVLNLLFSANIKVSTTAAPWNRNMDNTSSYKGVKPAAIKLLWSICSLTILLNLDQSREFYNSKNGYFCAALVLPLLNPLALHVWEICSILSNENLILNRNYKGMFTLSLAQRLNFPFDQKTTYKQMSQRQDYHYATLKTLCCGYDILSVYAFSNLQIMQNCPVTLSRFYKSKQQQHWHIQHKAKSVIK